MHFVTSESNIFLEYYDVGKCCIFVASLRAHARFLRTIIQIFIFVVSAPHILNFCHLQFALSSEWIYCSARVVIYCLSTNIIISVLSSNIISQISSVPIFRTSSVQVVPTRESLNISVQPKLPSS